MIDDFLELEKYYCNAIDEVTKDTIFCRSITHKFKHSVEVWNIGRSLLNQTSELADQTKEFKRFAELALLFHDVGRFREAVIQYEAQQKNIKITPHSYDHGLIGYEILKENEQYNDKRILFSIKWHGKMMDTITSSPDWQEAMSLPYFDDIKKILFLVRDADKLANLRHAKNDNHLEKDLFYFQLTQDALHASISENVFHQFLNQETILFKTVYSFANRILMVLSWIYDLNYEETKKIFEKNGYAEFLIELLTNYHHNHQDIIKIREMVAQWRK